MSTKVKKANAPTRKRGEWDDVPPLPIGAKQVYCTAQVRLAIGGLCAAEFARKLAAGDFPRPDWKLGKLNRWKRETVEQWLVEQEEKANGMGGETE